ncbi:NAD(P)H-binding protein [Haloechinothrix sp. YIM 98757]|uniref:NAD(P)H-binding protein n=1 Tax=Haloechinothrix aidingensis TaxID=2752311 RepID=A0A838ABD0_9PSEU|nr:PEP-utilizing enzyme [Haloechinothrix aidingensis]MBA0126541.1 NAD(P)H-binding protein [Haloechinothrix aidingensis]
MRVLVTGVTEQSGWAVARRLLAAGHEVVGLASRPHRYVDPRVELVVGDPGDERVCARAVTGCAAVVHLHWVQPRRGDTGHENVRAAGRIARAARDAGARIVLPSTSELGHDSTGTAGRRRSSEARLRAMAEQAVLASGATSVIVRAAPLAGRRADAASCTTLASLLRAPEGESWQLLHNDDYERFLTVAATSAARGIVALACRGTIDPPTARRILREHGAPTSARRVPGIPCPPSLDTAALSEEWEFHCGWSAAEVVEDLARGLVGRTPRRDGAVPLRGRIPLPSHVIPARVPASDEHPLEVAAPDGLEGEFDDRIDSRFPVYTATNTSEALPGPMTPATIDLHVGAIRLANEQMGRMLAFDGLAMEQWNSRVISVFGHHVYINVSVGVLTAENMPGWDEDSIRSDVYGNVPTDVELLPHGRPPMPEGLAGVKATATVMGRVIATARRYRASAEHVYAAAHREALGSEAILALTDEQLETRARLWRDRLGHAWAAAAIGVMMTGAAKAIHERKHPGEEPAIDVRELASARTMLGVERLAEYFRADAKLCALGKAGDVTGVRAASPGFAAALDAELDTVGHRGPGECELANPVFADRPEMLVTAAANAASLPVADRSERPRGRSSRTARMTAGATIARERARDAVVRVNHCLRLVLRERGRRLAAAGVLREMEDIFYLSMEEAFHPPSDAAERAARRRGERERLRELSMPDVITGRWEPTRDSARLAAQEQLSGLGVCGGVVEGPVKLVASVDDEIEPGDVLVASVTDTGHTAMFGYAAAVVTDLGGAASHAAIVAREFGIPCVVDTKCASGALTDGQAVRVDGSAGTVTVVGRDDAVGTDSGEVATEGRAR